jgi:transposase-like protein
MAENEWTDELKQEVIEAYEALEPTPETTMDAVKEVANDFGKTANGVRMILSKAGVYVKKTAAAGESKSTSTGAKRVNKAEAIAALKKVIEDAGKEVDDDICDRLTGKAAVYITSLLS